MEPLTALGGSLEHSLMNLWEKATFGWLLAPVRTPRVSGVLESYLQGRGSLAAPRAPLGQGLLGIHVVLEVQIVLAVPKVLGSLADP